MFKYLFLILRGKFELYAINYYVVWELLIHPYWEYVLWVLDKIIDAEDELVYLGVLRLKHTRIQIFLMRFQ